MPAGNATGVFAAKMAFFDRLAYIQATQGLLPGVSISYDEAPDYSYAQCIYGGGVRLQHQDMLDNYGLMVSEESSFSVYLRCLITPVGSVRTTDGMVNALANALVGVMVDNSDLGTGHTWRGIGRGQGDFANTDDETISYLALEMKVGSQFSYRNA